MAKEIRLEDLDALLAKGQELKALLESSPEIAAFAEILRENSKPVFVIPGERLVRAGEAARILGGNENTIAQYVRDGRLKAYYTPGSCHRKFMLSAVWSIPECEQSRA